MGRVLASSRGAPVTAPQRIERPSRAELDVPEVIETRFETYSPVPYATHYDGPPAFPPSGCPLPCWARFQTVEARTQLTVLCVRW